jgi:hypothetical protein
LRRWHRENQCHGGAFGGHYHRQGTVAVLEHRGGNVVLALVVERDLGDRSQRVGAIFSSTEHRVIKRYGKDRYSVAFFVYPSHSIIVEPVVDQTNCEFNPVACGEDMLTFFRRVYPQRVAGGA